MLQWMFHRGIIFIMHHSLIFVNADSKPKGSSDVPFHKTIYWYNKVDWNSFRSYITEASVSALFKNGSSRMSSLISDSRFSPALKALSLTKIYQQKSVFAVVLTHCNHYYHLYQREWCSRTLASWTLHNNCKSPRKCKEQLCADSLSQSRQ